MDKMKCDMCEQEFVPETTDDYYADDSGDYHIECYENWILEQGRIYAGILGVKLASYGKET